MLTACFDVTLVYVFVDLCDPDLSVSRGVI